jgi:glycosyltransferase involved in cell wall biosynthesis
MKITARVNTLDEEHNIVAALESLAWADEILVVDSWSKDRTVELARQHGAQVVQHDFRSHGEQHNYADTLASHDWVFVLDADERVTPELRASIEKIRQKGPKCSGYRFARRAHFMGRWIRHCGWYPDYQTRLYDRRATQWGGDPPHEEPKVNGPVEIIPGELLHYTKRNLKETLDQTNFFTSLAARDRHRRGKRAASYLKLLLLPPLIFLHSYVWKRGFLDGLPGLVISWLAAFYVFAREAKLREHYLTEAQAPSEESS